MEPKKALRKRLIDARLAISEELRAKMDKDILNIFTGTSVYIESETILSYYSYNGEADTHELIKRAIKDGKRVACPVSFLRDDIPTLDFYYISSPDELKSGYKGIPEPETDVSEKVSDEDIANALIIVPMVGFDSEGNRLGYGRGFYDRFFSSGKHGCLTALAYTIQECESIPTDEYDIKPDIIITNDGIRMIRTDK